MPVYSIPHSSRHWAYTVLNKAEVQSFRGFVIVGGQILLLFSKNSLIDDR